jgi:predicted nucleic acid-binding protein
MNDRVIIDTTIWSLALRRHIKSVSSSEQTSIHLLRELIIANQAILIGVVRQEILTGIPNPTTFDTIRDYLHSFEDLQLDPDDYEQAAAFDNQCRRSGIATSIVDMLICSVAASREVPIFTADHDFARYVQHLPIRLYRN